MAKVAWTYGGRLKHDYIGAHIVYMVNGTRTLGTVTGTYRDEDDVLMFTVKHFNGEPAPSVGCGAAWILERTHEPTECPSCEGDGFASSGPESNCPKCGGRGKV